MQKPIFIVGCPSSGTTLLYSLLTSNTNISCGEETDFLIILREITEGKYWNKLQRYDFEKEYWNQQIAKFFSSFKIDYAKKQNKKRWADKTPSYTVHLDFIYKLFPDCQFIHIIRDGRDVVKSHQERWGYRWAIKANYIWNKHVTTARNFGQTLPAEQYMEVHYEDLVRQPESTAKSIFNYLQEPWDSGILDITLSEVYQKNPGYKSIVDSKKQQDIKESLIYTSQIGKGNKLDPFLKLLIFFKNEKLLKELGYV